MTTEIAFPEADLQYLETAAVEVGIKADTPRDIREAQKLKKRGLPVPGDLEPEEAWLLQEIAKKIEGGSVPPKGIIVYFNDRMHENLPEDDVQTTLFCQQRVAFNRIKLAVDRFSSELKK
jgi:hypothetical protein